MHIAFESAKSGGVQPEERPNIGHLEGLSLEIGIVNGVSGSANLVAVTRVGFEGAFAEWIAAKTDGRGAWNMLVNSLKI